MDSATFPWRDEAPLGSVSPTSWVLIANPNSRRVTLFQTALASLGLPSATVMAYRELLAGRVVLSEHLPPGALLRLESPGQDFEVEKALLAAGAKVHEDSVAQRLSPTQVEALVFDKGRILCPRQWYRGFCEVLRIVDQQRAECPPHRITSPTSDIAELFDKDRCAQRLAAAGIAVPPGLGSVRDYEDLRERMNATGHRRVFVKLSHGSSASGVVAYETAGPREQAMTSVELVSSHGEIRLYNSRRIRRYRERREIKTIIDLLCREGVRVEAWIPKAALQGQVFDLRVVVIAGRPRHGVVRLGSGPMTNLHLKNRRAEAILAQKFLGEEGWQAVLTTCTQVARLYPNSLHLGIDVAVTPGGRRHVVLEVNAFGDLLHGITHEGEGTYEAEIREVERGWAAP